MLDEIKAVQASADLVFSQSAVSAAIDAMAQNINSQLAEANPLVLCVLNGGIIASGHLLPRLTMPLTLDSINASRYRNQTVGGDINWLVKPTTPLQGRTILVIDDILDEGLTLLAIKQYCLEQGAAAVYCAVLMDKMLGHDKPITADFVGLNVPNRYLFGYGMDYKGYLRNAAGIFACKDV
jgi:hypoxanthine phosphoribosyltransferase